MRISATISLNSVVKQYFEGDRFLSYLVQETVMESPTMSQNCVNMSVILLLPFKPMSQKGDFI
jgi:hypothetical protein